MPKHSETVRSYLSALSAMAPPDQLAAFFHPDLQQTEFPNRLVPDGATRDLAANQHGCGRELFFNFRANAIGAEQGGSTFGSTLPGPVEACQT